VSKLNKSLLINSTNIWRLEVITLKSYTNIVFFVYLCHAYSTNDNSEAAGHTRGGTVVCDQNPWVAYLAPHRGGLYLSGQWRQASLCIRRYRFVDETVCRLRSACIRLITHMMTGLGCTLNPFFSAFGQQPWLWFIPVYAQKRKGQKDINILFWYFWDIW